MFRAVRMGKRARCVQRKSLAAWSRGGTVLVLLLSVEPAARACDLCAIYMATEQRESRTGILAGIAEQYSDYETWQRGGQEVPNPAGERMHSFITQLIGGYTFTPRLGLQINVPVIVRKFRRQEMQGVVNGDESGIGDLSVVGSWEAYSEVTENTLTRFTLAGGLKLPSGNSRRLKEELTEMEAVESAIHGHDLALGSGSVDGILGAQLFWSWRRVFVTGAIQYVLRTEGDVEYAFADDLMWSAGPGAFVLLTHDYTVGVQVELSGESKGNDTLSGVKRDDTAITALYLGPDIRFTWGTSLGANLAIDLPVLQHNTALQIVPDVRLRGGLTWRF
jgi:hypothetical protein